jgi:hypothetical protein
VRPTIPPPHYSSLFYHTNQIYVLPSSIPSRPRPVQEISKYDKRQKICCTSHKTVQPNCIIKVLEVRTCSDDRGRTLVAHRILLRNEPSSLVVSSDDRREALTLCCTSHILRMHREMFLEPRKCDVWLRVWVWTLERSGLGRLRTRTRILYRRSESGLDFWAGLCSKKDDE